jgi:hypothetical protein
MPVLPINANVPSNEKLIDPSQSQSPEAFTQLSQMLPETEAYCLSMREALSNDIPWETVYAIDKVVRGRHPSQPGLWFLTPMDILKFNGFGQAPAHPRQASAMAYAPQQAPRRYEQSRSPYEQPRSSYDSSRRSSYSYVALLANSFNS